MTEKEFLEKRLPFWLESEDLQIITPTNTDKMDVHSRLARKYHYNWLGAIRGYYWPGSHVMLYQGDYETPNCSILVATYLLNYFSDAKWIGFGCNKGKIGEIWTPKVIIPRDISLIKV